MALITCPECKQQVSDQVPYCVHCGYPLKPRQVPPQQQQQKTSDIWEIYNRMQQSKGQQQPPPPQGQPGGWQQGTNFQYKASGSQQEYRGQQFQQRQQQSYQQQNQQFQQNRAYQQEGQRFHQGPVPTPNIKVQVPVVKKKSKLLHIAGAILGILIFFTLIPKFLKYVEMAKAEKAQNTGQGEEKSINNEEKSISYEESNISYESPTQPEAEEIEEAAGEPQAPEYFRNNVLVCNDYTITITSYKVLQKGEKGNEYGDGPVIAFWYDTTNVSGEEVDATSAWISIFSAYQDNDPNIENKLNVSSLPDEKFSDTQIANIKKGGTVSNAVGYELSDTFTPVMLKAKRLFDDDPLGEQTFEITSNSISKSSQEEPKEKNYVLNTNTKKIHNPDCPSVDDIAPENYEESNLSLEELEAQGYSRCGRNNEHW